MEKDGIILIGGSAGSIEVIIKLIAFIPADFQHAIVVVIHRKATVEYHLEDVLNRKSKVKVFEIQDKMKLEKNNIYLVPGDYHLLIDNTGLMSLDVSEKVNYCRPSIDVTFECFAKEFGNRLIGILLSGANADGAAGLKKIKDRGGVTIVQSPESATVATMPMAAISLFYPDLIADTLKICNFIHDISLKPIEQIIIGIKKGEEIEDNISIILLVDDLEDNLFSLNAILKSDPYIIHKTTSGKQAIEMAMKTAYDCIVLDVQMPEMDGFEVAKKLSQQEETKNIPIIFLSALGSDNDKIVEGLEAGAVDFIAKPPEPSIIKIKIKNCIKLSKKTKHSTKKISSINSEFHSLKEYTNDVAASLRYAQNIQQAILPTPESMRSVCKDSFVIYAPKEAIGGDFYYIKKFEEKRIIICGDCTGHGVPGAMMSMISVNILNNILDNKGIIEPSKILQTVVREFNTAFTNEFNSNSIQDGLELSICLHDTKNNKLYFSGAGSRIYISINQKLIKLKGSLVGINSYTSFDEQFPETVFDINGRCLFYMFSDGVVDQFGGEKGKKFTSKRLEKVLEEIQTDSMTNQKSKLSSILNDWRGANEQIDDIILMGIEL